MSWEIQANWEGGRDWVFLRVGFFCCSLFLLNLTIFGGVVDSFVICYLC